MSLGSIPPVEGRVLEGCDPVTHVLSGGLFEAAEGCLYLYPTFIFTFSLCPCAMRGNHQHILVQGGKCRKMVLFPREPGGPCRLHTWSVLLQGSEDVVAFLACWGRIAVWERPLKAAPPPSASRQGELALNDLLSFLTLRAWASPVTMAFQKEPQDTKWLHKVG